MAEITAALVKELREKSGAGIDFSSLWKRSKIVPCRNRWR